MFPKLYGLPSNGKKVKEWFIDVYEEGNTAFIKRIHGYTGCKMQETIKEISKGKNIGKKNETTPLQQASNEAQSLWKKQIDSGYVENVDKLQSNEKILPMLAHDFHKREKDITFPCFAQPKLDGVRLLAKVNSPTEISFISRTGKEMTTLNHIDLELKIIIKKLPEQDFPFYIDGELFTFDLPFEEISGLFRKIDKDEKIKMLQFHIFDVFKDNTTVFSDRIIILNQFKTLIDKLNSKSLIIVDTIECASKNEISEIHGKYMLNQYEGLILRNKLGVYKSNYRSKDLQKYKEFFDDEFEITGAQSGVGLEQDCAIFTCKNKAGKEFAVRPRGTRELRKEYLKNIKNIIGKQLTVRYQNLSESGIVRFGVGIAIRDYE